MNVIAHAAFILPALVHSEQRRRERVHTEVPEDSRGNGEVSKGRAKFSLALNRWSSMR
jgi:hypothetical protein